MGTSNITNSLYTQMEGYLPMSLWTAALPLVLAALVYRWFAATGKHLNPPPAPKGLPIIGQTLIMANAKFSWITFYEFSKALAAPVMLFSLGTSKVLVINTVKAATDLLEKKGAIYSDRPKMIVTSGYVSKGRRTVLTPYNGRWRKMRRFLHAILYDKQAIMYEPVQLNESKALALSLLESPKEFAGHCQLFSSNIILQIVYGRRAATVEDSCIQDMVLDMQTWGEWALPGQRLVDDFPMLDLIPAFLSPWKREAMKLHEFEVKLYTRLTAGVRAKMAKGEQPECIMRHLIDRMAEFELDDMDILYMAGTLFEAGSDTTTSTLHSLFLACTNNPSVVAAAHEELDRVVGQDRMPNFSDFDKLPYITALTKEVQRWRPAVPSAVPHRLMEDDSYMGYDLPKGATVIGNTWGIGRDPEFFPDGEAFRPDRYLGEEGAAITAAWSKGHSNFGFGRRICPGYHVATHNLFITYATILWAFNLGPVKGEPLPDVDNYAPGFVTRSRPFNVSITPRSAARAAMIRAEGGLAMQEMSELYE